MRILVVTNLYPPQELGGYGRCIGDFVWGLVSRGHSVHVLCADADYLNPPDNLHSGLEDIHRDLRLKGSYENGVTLIRDHNICTDIDTYNVSIIRKHLSSHWDGVLLGNIDLLGTELFAAFSDFKSLILHHVGFILPPYESWLFPNYLNYTILPASQSVKQSLISSGFPIQSSPVVYPEQDAIFYQSSLHSLALRHSLTMVKNGFMFGSGANPLKIGFAGLIMPSKDFIIIQAMLHLKNIGYSSS